MTFSPSSALPDNFAASLPEADRDKPTWLRAGLSARWWEIALVIVVMLGPDVFISVSKFVMRWKASDGQRHITPNYLGEVLNGESMLFQLSLEAFCLGGMLAFLSWRGWRPADCKIRPSWKGTLVAPLLFASIYLSNEYFLLGLSYLSHFWNAHPQGMGAYFAAYPGPVRVTSLHLSVWAIIGLSLMNGFFEEFIYLSYLFNQVAVKYGPALGLVVTVLLRLAIHAYQGPNGALANAALGIIFGGAYWCFRRLWPVALAHALDDGATLVFLKSHYGL